MEKIKTAGEVIWKLSPISPLPSDHLPIYTHQTPLCCRHAYIVWGAGLRLGVQEISPILSNWAFFPSKLAWFFVQDLYTADLVKIKTAKGTRGGLRPYGGNDGAPAPVGNLEAISIPGRGPDRLGPDPRP